MSVHPCEQTNFWETENNPSCDVYCMHFAGLLQYNSTTWIIDYPNRVVSSIVQSVDDHMIYTVASYSWLSWNFDAEKI